MLKESGISSFAFYTADNYSGRFEFYVEMTKKILLFKSIRIFIRFSAENAFRMTKYLEDELSLVSTTIHIGCSTVSISRTDWNLIKSNHRRKESLNGHGKARRRNDPLGNTENGIKVEL